MPRLFEAQTKALKLFEGRSSSEINVLLEGATEKVLKHRECLFRAGDEAHTFAVVVQGALKLVKSTAPGDDIIVYFATPGEAIGAILMMRPGSQYPVTSLAMGGAVVLQIPRATYLRSWMQDLHLQKCMGGMMFNRVSLLHDQKALAKAPLAQKIAHQIVTLIERSSGEDETILPIPLTRQEIADSVGASVESVIRVMSDWNKKGIVETSDQVIRLLKTESILEILKGFED